VSSSYDVDSVTSRASFVRFVEALLADWREGSRAERQAPSSPYGAAASGWENPTLERFLEALASYTEDAELPEQPSWHTFAQVLAAARIYE
jgi:hypothetical protein